MTTPPDYRVEIKTALVDALARVPSYRGQRWTAFVVRHVWPAFRRV
jgi:hypothetical protein